MYKFACFAPQTPSWGASSGLLWNPGRRFGPKSADEASRTSGEFRTGTVALASFGSLGRGILARPSDGEERDIMVEKLCTPNLEQVVLRRCDIHQGNSRYCRVLVDEAAVLVPYTKVSISYRTLFGRRLAS